MGDNGEVYLQADVKPSPVSNGRNSRTASGNELTAMNRNEEEKVGVTLLKQMREKVLSNRTIINCRLDAGFLLRFLRAKKMHLDAACQLLENYLEMRQDNPLWFKNLDVLHPSMASLIDSGYFFALPKREKSGRRVFFSIAGALDPSIYTASDMMRVVQLGLESLLEDEENQIRGFTYIFDGRNVGFSTIRLWTLSEITQAFYCCEKTVPVRHKEIHIMNLPLPLWAVFEFAKTLLSEKIKSRFQVHSDAEKLHRFIPPEILPQEYGGKMPLMEMIKMYKEELVTARPNVLRLDCMQTDKNSNHKR